MMVKFLIAAIFMAPFVAVPEATEASRGTCQTKTCVKKKTRKYFSYCNTWNCVYRNFRREMREYKRNPLPYCTWGPESNFDPATGRSYHGRPWAYARYRIKNPFTTASGKYQAFDSTWAAFGGAVFTSAAHQARRVIQERIARRIASDSLHHWVNC